MKIEVWECEACGKGCPCRVEITYTDKGLPKHLAGRERFSGACLCNEPVRAAWLRLADKEQV